MCLVYLCFRDPGDDAPLVSSWQTAELSGIAIYTVYQISGRHSNLLVPARSCSAKQVGVVEPRARLDGDNKLNPGPSLPRNFIHDSTQRHSVLETIAKSSGVIEGDMADRVIQRVVLTPREAGTSPNSRLGFKVEKKSLLKFKKLGDILVESDVGCQVIWPISPAFLCDKSIFEPSTRMCACENPSINFWKVETIS